MDAAAPTRQQTGVGKEEIPVIAGAETERSGGSGVRNQPSCGVSIGSGSGSGGGR